MLAFSARYDSPNARVENVKILHSITLPKTGGNDADDHQVLKCLLERIEVLEPISQARYRYWEWK